MISLGLAQKLSNAGQKPITLNGCCCFVYRLFNHNYLLHVITDWRTDDVRVTDLPALELEHLRREIEKFNIGWSIEKAGDEYFCYLYRDGNYLIKRESDSPEEAMGETLLFLLEDKDWIIISDEGFWNQDEGWVKTYKAATINELRKYLLPEGKNCRWEKYDPKKDASQDKFHALINVIGSEKASEYMYMGFIHGIYLYKHIETREYINVTAEGQFYSYNWKDGYLPIETPCSVLKDGRDSVE